MVRRLGLWNLFAYAFIDVITIKFAKWLLHIFDDAFEIAPNYTRISDVHHVLIVSEGNVLLENINLFHLLMIQFRK